MIKEFEDNGIKILKVYFCPHSPEENCNCRKPNIGMIKNACEDFIIDLENSWLIGDKISDIQTAINANIKNHIFLSFEGKKPFESSFKANKLIDTIKIIKS